VKSFSVGWAGISHDAWARLFNCLELGGGGGDSLFASFFVLSSDTLLISTLDISVADVSLKANCSLAGAATKGS